jgi:superfamily II DNA helicase RecQ
MGLRTAVVNGETWQNCRLQKVSDESIFSMLITHLFVQKLRRIHYQVVIASPEMCLEHSGFRKILSDVAFHKNISHLVTDEAHCITEWDPEFRPAWMQIGTIRNPCVMSLSAMSKV